MANIKDEYDKREIELSKKHDKKLEEKNRILI